MADIYARSKSVNKSKIDKAFDEAYRIFNQLKSFYWSGETRFRQGVYCCQSMRISSGFKNLLESERIFEKISEKAKPFFGNKVKGMINIGKEKTAQPINLRGTRRLFHPSSDLHYQIRHSKNEFFQRYGNSNALFRGYTFLNLLDKKISVFFK